MFFVDYINVVNNRNHMTNVMSNIVLFLLYYYLYVFFLHLNHTSCINLFKK